MTTMGDHRDIDGYESDTGTESDLDFQEQQEMEIALYSQLHYVTNENVTENDEEKNNYHIDVTFQNDKTDMMPMLKSSENYPSQCLNTTESLGTENIKLCKEVLPKMSKRLSVQDNTEGVINISDDESVISIDSEMSGASDCEFEVGSDIMILDEYISDMEDIKVHVNDNQKTMLKKLTHKNTEEELKESEKWAILDQDRYSGSDLSKRYYKSISVRCKNCRDTGHLSRDCPKPQKNKICFLCGYTGHNNKNCPNGICYNCEQIGHMSFDCQNSRINPHIECHRCSMFGHHQKDCPDIWRQFHMTTIPGTLRQTQNKENSKMFCCNCASSRHFGFNCPMGRADKHSYPSYPFIGVYRQYRNWEKDPPLKRKRDYYGEEEEETHKNKKARHEDCNRNRKYTSFATKIKEKIKSKFANKSGKESESEQPSTSKGNNSKERRNKNKNFHKNSDSVSSTNASEMRTVVINKEKNNRASLTLHRETDDDEFKHQAFNNHYWEKKQGKKKKNKKKKNKKGNNNEQYTQGSSNRNDNIRTVNKTNRGFQISLNTQKTQLMFKR